MGHSSFSSRRLLVWSVGVLLLVGLGVGVVGYLVWPALDLEAAERLLRQNDPAAARVRLDRYLARRPGDGPALLLAAQAARRADACADAERLLTAAEEASGPSAATRLEWALLGAQQGDFANEEDRLKADARPLNPDTPLILEALGKGYTVAYRYPEAVAVLGQLLERNPGHVPGLILRGTVLDRLRQQDPAEADFRRAVDLAPESATAHAALAGLLNRRGHTREAVAHYEAARRYGVLSAASQLGLARALTDAAELDQTVQLLDELIAADPGNADALVERGRLALRQNRAAEAEPFLERAVAAAPWHRDATRLQIIALKELGQTEALARATARAAEQRSEDGTGGKLKLRARDNPKDVAVRWDLWQWSVSNGQTGPGDEGFAWLTEIVRLDPHHAGAQAALADWFGRAGQPRRAALHREKR